MAQHRYDLPPDPNPHSPAQDVACIAQLVGILLGAVAVAAGIGWTLGNIILWVLA